MKIKNTLVLLACVGVLASCSQVSKSVKSVTKLGGQQDASEQSDIVIPPALALPSGVSRTNNYQPKPIQKTSGSSAISNKNYYVVVGTYPNPEKAMDTFIRLSSIGLPNATMESRQTKTGKSLHMVRLGPFKRQSQIDKVKDSLRSDGLTQFKVVEN